MVQPLRASDLTLRLPDAIVLATGQVLDATVLTADRRWARHGERVRLIG
jgi:PIN domain nuclease of toxin-antitoxin system